MKRNQVKRNQVKQTGKTGTILGERTVFDGELEFCDSLSVKGAFSGRIESEGSLFIEQGSRIDADLKVNSIVIDGRVRGNIDAGKRLECLENARIEGNIKTRRLKIAEGVGFKGRFEMIRDAALIDVFSADVKKLKDTVQYV